MSDPADPSSWGPTEIISAVLAGIATVVAAVGAALRGIFRGRDRDEERAEIREALAALRQSVEELRAAVQKSDKDLALIAHTLGEKSARNDRMEKRLDDLEREFSEVRETLANMRGYSSGIAKAPR